MVKGEIPVREMIKRSIERLGGKATKKQIIDWINENYTDVNESTIDLHLYSLSVNAPGRINHGRNQKERPLNDDYDFLYKKGNDFEIYDSSKHGKYELIESNGKIVVAKEGIPLSNDTDSPLLKFLKDEMKMQANYQPIVIKILLEKGNESGYTATIKEVREKIQELNFDRDDFLNDAISSVAGALKKFVSFTDEKANLHLDQFSAGDIPTCLKICGQEIAKWHITNIVKNDFRLWRVKPGREETNFKFLDEFLDSNTIGVGWNNFPDLGPPLSEEESIEKMRKIEPEFGSVSSITSLTHKMKPGDIVVLTKAQQEIVDFGIITGLYFYLRNIDDNSYAHRRKVVWFKQGPINKDELPPNLLGGSMASIHEVISKKYQTMGVLLGKHSIAAIKAHSCFIITQNQDSKYEDIEGKQYQYDNFKANYKQLMVGSKFVVQSKKNGTNYFVGFGKVDSIDSNPTTNEKGKPITKIIAKFSEYQKFKEPKLRTNEIFEEMKTMKEYGSQPPAILPITRQLFKKITGQDLDDNDEKITDMYSEYAEILNRKKQIIFYGPPGTGKTFTANHLADFLTKNNSSTSTLTFRSAAIKILHDENREMNYNEITKLAFERNLLHTSGETPEFTLLKEMSKDIQQNGNSSVFKKVKKGIYTLNPEVEFDEELKLAEKSLSGSLSNFKRYVTFHQSYSYEEFIEGIKPSSVDGNIVYGIEPGIFRIICEDATADPANKYVILIDEINRGNISKIFGELITLIEKDKRKTHTLQLAYSKEFFSVPENVYIIATMNTADRSLIQIDAALRRRFAFYELMPDSKLLTKNIEEISLRGLLEELNKRIIDAGLREKQIGHSYFLEVNNLEDLQFVFANEIVPLLQDYFFDDYKRLEEELLSGDFIDSQNMIIKDDWKKDPKIFLSYLKNTFKK